MNTRTRLQETRHSEVPMSGKVIRNIHDALLSFSIDGPCRVPVPVPVPLPVPDRNPLRRVPGARNLFAACAAVLLLASAKPASAVTTDYTADGRLVDVGIKVQGQQAPMFVRNGDWNRWYFQAFEGLNYSIVLRNNTGRRIGVLVAVDGLNVVNGEKSRLRSNEAMYVLNPWSSAEIAGWRTSLQAIRRFVFVDEERSYAERTGQANGDMGWLRVLAFEELKPWKDQPDVRFKNGHGTDELDGRGSDLDSRQRRDAPVPESAAPRAQADESRKALPYSGGSQSFPGTGWGDKGWDPVQRTQFTAASRATDQLAFRYEYASGLQALGIFPDRRGRLWERDNGQLGFAKPPKW